MVVIVVCFSFWFPPPLPPPPSPHLVIFDGSHSQTCHCAKRLFVYLSFSTCVQTHTAHIMWVSARQIVTYFLLRNFVQKLTNKQAISLSYILMNYIFQQYFLSAGYVECLPGWGYNSSSTAHSYSICSVLCVQTMVWLPALWIFNVHADVDARDWKWRLYENGDCLNTIKEPALRANCVERKIPCDY